MDTENYVRKPFGVEAVRLTSENLFEVANWCRGTVEKDKENRPYIKVNVRHPLNPRQTRAYIGDWVLSSSRGFKIYTNQAFRNNFDPGVYLEFAKDENPPDSNLYLSGNVFADHGGITMNEAAVNAKDAIAGKL